MSSSLQLQRLLCSLLLIFLYACTTYPTVQPQVQTFLITGEYDRAINTLDRHRRDYGAKNELLFLLDRAMALQLAGRYSESAADFEKAKHRYEELYTQSVSRHAASWLMNDYTLPYRGEDFERVMANIFNAMNYCLVGDIEGALVEARDVNSILTAINQQYPSDQKNVYRDDAFARFLSGVLYEVSGRDQDLNDAWIDYRRSVNLYESDYKVSYGFKDIPAVLKENILMLAQGRGGAEWSQYNAKFSGVTIVPPEERQKMAQVYLIFSHGFSPVKTQDNLVLPVPEGHLVKMAFPKYRTRMSKKLEGMFCAKSSNGDSCAAPELMEDIEAIAKKNLENRKLRVLVKAGLRPLIKSALAWGAEQQLDKSGERGAAQGVHYTGILYGLISEQTDLRSWQTLPSQIWLARLTLWPGEYEFFFKRKSVGRLKLSPGQTKFFMLRTW